MSRGCLALPLSVCRRLCRTVTGPRSRIEPRPRARPSRAPSPPKVTISTPWAAHGCRRGWALPGVGLTFRLVPYVLSRARLQTTAPPNPGDEVAGRVDGGDSGAGAPVPQAGLPA